MKTLLSIFALITVTLSGFSQASTNCHIIYQYDACGNRIKRTKDCPSASGSRFAKPVTESAFEMKVFPNPTNAAFSVYFDKVVSEGYLQLIDMKGNIIQTKAANGSNYYNFDIAHLAQGAYIITFYAKGIKPLVQQVLKSD